MPKAEDGERSSMHRPPMRMRQKVVLRVCARLVAPLIFLFAFYVQFHGDFGPGGGFQAGVIFAAGLVLYSLVFGYREAQQVISERWAERVLSVGVLLYGGVGVTTLLLGGDFLDYNQLGAHGQHWGIFTVELGVGVAVAGTMIRIFYLYAALDPRSFGETDW